MRFNPLFLTSIIVEPLRYFFGNYTSDQGLVWSADDKVSSIEVGSINDFNTIELQQKPRILVGRGGYQVMKSGLSDNLKAAPGIKQSYGANERTNLVYIQGQAQIIIESKNEGTCELVADMVSHFLVWSSPLLCSSQGFNAFAIPLAVSNCQVLQEDTEKFQVTIDIPWRMEEDWSIKQDAIKLKGFFMNFTPVPANVT